MAIDFEEHRGHLRGVAFRMLGSLAEADDAVQEAWLRLDRADPSDVANPRGWLTTVVARIALDMLRARTSRREDAMGSLDSPVESPAAADPKAELMLAESVGQALMVVLDRLEPAERIAFVLHDVCGMAFDEIGPIVSRSVAATRQLASRARRRVQGSQPSEAELASQRHVVDRFIAALRHGDLHGLIAILDPEIAVRFGDSAGKTSELTGGADHVGRTWIAGAAAFAQFADMFTVSVIDGAVGLALAPKGRLVRAVRFTFEGDRIALVEIIVDRARLDALEIATLG